MNTAKHALAAMALAAATLAASATAARAGTVTGATGAFRVNGSDVTLASGKTLALKKNDVLDTMKSTVTYRSDTGDEISFEAGDTVKEMETDATGAQIFLSKGSATAVLTEKTNLGVAAGWIAVRKGEKAKVYVETTAGRESVEALFRSTEGVAWVRYQDFDTELRPAHSVTFDINPRERGYLLYRTGQQNAADVVIHKRVAGGEILAIVPKASVGYFADVPNENKTKICDDINSLKTAKIHLETKFVGKSKNDADIGPGTCAQVDNATGAIEVLFTAVKFEILERAISLTSEFSTLAQSNFSDVK